MPTATGLPQRGEWLKDAGGYVWQVVARHGARWEDFSLTLEPHPGHAHAKSVTDRIARHHLMGDKPGTMRLLEAGYWLSEMGGAAQWKPYEPTSVDGKPVPERMRPEREVRAKLAELRRRRDDPAVQHSAVVTLHAAAEALAWVLGSREAEL